ncbi:hypothetical protein HDU97_006303 [Phlyctochytrium planicorne]|nr:hypothetical protein HDU97_006303 [Phlyctochytrium planicorne]
MEFAFLRQEFLPGLDRSSFVHGSASLLAALDKSFIPMLLAPQTTTQVDYGDRHEEDDFANSTIWIDKVIIEKLCATSNKHIPYEVVRRRRFLEEFEQSNPLLRNAMCAFASLMSVPPAPLSIVQHYYEEARKNIADALEAPSLQSLQGIITLSMVSNMLENYVAVFMQIGVAARMMSLLGFDNLSDDFDSNPDLSFEEKETIKRCFLSCFAFDRGFTTRKPLNLLPGKSHADILKNTPSLAASDADWFGLRSSSRQQILTAPSWKPASPQSSPPVKISSAYLPTPNLDVNVDITHIYSETPPTTPPTPLPLEQDPPDIPPRNLKEMPNLMLAANIIAMLFEITDAENRFGRLKDIAGMGCGGDENEARKGTERLQIYLTHEATLEDWYDEIPEQRKLVSPLESVRKGLRVGNHEVRPGIFLHPSVLAERTPVRQELVLGSFMVFFLYSCCRLQLHRPRLNLRSMLVKQEADFFMACMVSTCHPIFENSLSPPTPMISLSPPQDRSHLSSDSSATPQPPPSQPPTPPQRPKFDYATSARLRKSTYVCLEAVRDMVIIESVVSKVKMAPGYRKSPVAEYCIAVSCQSLLEMYLTLTTAGKILYPSTRSWNGLDVKALNQNSWIASVVERDEDGQTHDEATWSAMLDEVVTLMSLSLFFVKAFSVTSKAKNHHTGLHPDIVKLMQDTVTLHEYKSRRRQNVTPPTGALFELLKLSATLHAMGLPVAPDLPMTSLGRLMAEIASLGDLATHSPEIHEMVEREESLHLENMEMVLERARVHGVDRETMNFGKGMMASMY